MLVKPEDKSLATFANLAMKILAIRLAIKRVSETGPWAGFLNAGFIKFTSLRPEFGTGTGYRLVSYLPKVGGFL